MTGEALPCSTEVGCGGYGRWKERGRDERERVEHGTEKGVLVHLHVYRGKIVYNVQVEIAKVTCTNLGILLAVG
jgi:hypothetical protein